MAQRQRSLPSSSQGDGQVLFQRFAGRETGIAALQDGGSTSQMSSSELKQAEDELNEIISQFARTPGRQKVRNLARKVSGLSLSQAYAMIKKVIDKAEHVVESIVVVFTFMSDLLKKIWEEGKQVFHTVVSWCSDTIGSLLEPVVQAAGGWRNLLIGAAALIISGVIAFGIGALLL